MGGRDGAGRGRAVWELTPEPVCAYDVSSRGSSTGRGGGDPNNSASPLRCISTLLAVRVDSTMLNLHTIPIDICMI